MDYLGKKLKHTDGSTCIVKSHGAWKGYFWVIWDNGIWEQLKVTRPSLSVVCDGGSE